ncbi:MAG: hypothetical protein J1E06_08550 [Acutalibacter sp.]|nr:hypothetical protein [Acutalibacter sp.]
MPKKYEIKKPSRCHSCDKASDCEYLKQLFLKPSDAGGIILDCKAFYIVFCELEERDRIPFDDPEKMKQYHEEKEAGKRPYLTPAIVTNGVLAAELALKALTLKETGTFDCVHEIDKLFYALPDDHKTALSAVLKEKTHQNDETLKINLETIGNFFVQWRYSFQSEAIGYSNFLPEFIHIVCDYAIDDIGKTMTEVSE